MAVLIMSEFPFMGLIRSGHQMIRLIRKSGRVLNSHSFARSASTVTSSAFNVANLLVECHQVLSDQFITFSEFSPFHFH